MNQKNSQINLGIAACAISVTSAREVQLLPAGQFRARVTGRPDDAPYWYIDAELASAIIADFDSQKVKAVIDYEHQTMLAAKNGQPAPASGWFSKLEWRDGVGLFATDVEWTDRAASMIEAKEYLYISPVFSYNKKTGAVKKLLHAALTNNPDLDGMEAVAANQFAQLIDQQLATEALSMTELLEQLRWLLNLPVTSTAEDVTTELQKAIDQIKTAAASAASVPGFDVVALIKSQADQIAALTASVANPDPSKFVDVGTMVALQAEVAALSAQINGKEVDEIVIAALSAGKILPAQEPWARSLGAKNLAALKEFVATAQPIAALTATQTDGKPPANTAPGAQLDENQLAVCKAIGTDPGDFAKTLQAQSV